MEIGGFDYDWGETEGRLPRLLFSLPSGTRKLIPSDPAAFFHKTDNPLGAGIRLRNLIQDLLYKFLSVHLLRALWG